MAPTMPVADEPQYALVAVESDPWDAETWSFGFLGLPSNEDLERKAEIDCKQWKKAKETLLERLQQIKQERQQHAELKELEQEEGHLQKSNCKLPANKVSKKEELLEEFWKKKVQAFDDMKLRNTTSQHFVIAVTVLGSRAVDYLKNLSVELCMEDWPEWRWLQREELPRRTVAGFDFPKWIEVSKVQNQAYRGPQEWIPSGWDSPFWNYLVSSYQVVDNCVFWMPTSRIIEPSGPSASSDRLRIIKALHNTGAESGVFDTAVGWAILQKAWQRYQYLYLRSRVWDIVLLLFFAVVTYYSNYKHVSTPNLIVAVTALASVRSLSLPLLETFTMFYEFGIYEGIAHSLTVWNLGLYVVEIFSAFTVLPLLYLEYRHEDTSAFKTHPVLFSLVVGARWCYFIMALMCTSYFGRNVFPAWHAMTQGTSLAFVGFLMLAVFGALQTYLVFPIPENNPANGHSFWLPFMKVFRFALMGDFDVWELEGIDPVISGNLTHGHLHASEDDGAPSDSYHDGIMFFVMFLSITMVILSMNVAIGVVGNLYTEAKEKAHQIYCHFKAGYLFKLMLQAYFRERFGYWLRTKCASHCFPGCLCFCFIDPEEGESPSFLISSCVIPREKAPTEGDALLDRVNALDEQFVKIHDVLRRLEERSRPKS